VGANGNGILKKGVFDLTHHRAVCDTVIVFKVGVALVHDGVCFISAVARFMMCCGFYTSASVFDVHIRFVSRLGHMDAKSL
jgi:hypothetical protein